MNILYLSLKNDLQGPFPKIDPLLVAGMNKLDCQVTKVAWGRHSENETLGEKIIGRFVDLMCVLLALFRKRYHILYVVTTLDTYALSRDIPLLLTTYCFPAKKVLIMHGSKLGLFTGKGYIFYKSFTRLLVLLSDAILLLSSEELSAWKKFEPRGKYYRVDNPFKSSGDMETGALTNAKQKTNLKPTLLFVGRLIKTKGIFDLLHAMPKILEQIDCNLLIAGDGVGKKEIADFIEKENLGGHVSLAGYVDSDCLSGFYRSASVFVLPTYFDEGFPTVLSEAMSYGLPIITTPIRGARDHLQNGINTLFVRPRNPDAIAHGVVQLLRDPILCLQMGRANIEKVREFKPENVVSIYVQIFHELLDEDTVSKINKISLIHYYAIANMLKFCSSTSFLRSSYRLLGNNLGRRHISASKIELDRGGWIIQKINKAGFPPGKELTVLELGSGWTHFYAIFLRLFKNAKITLFDVQDNRNFASLKKRFENLFNLLLTFPSHELSQLGELGQARELLERIIAVDSFEKLYRLLNMTYVIDQKGCLDLLPDNAFDVVFSVDVLEHVDKDLVGSSIRGIYRILKPGGISVQQIGLDDHLSHYVPGMPSKNYMRYSSKAWKLYFENRLQYINRLQLPDFLSLFGNNDFELIEQITEEDPGLDKLQLASEYLCFDSKTIRATRAYLVHRKPMLS